MLTNLTPELRALSTLIGSGRQTAGVSVALTEIDGEGVYLPLHYGGQECGLWLSQSCWQHWLNTTLATDNPQLLAAELVIAMANWAVTPLLALFTDLVVLAESPQKRSLPKQWAVTVAFELEGQPIIGVLQDWPQAALATLCLIGRAKRSPPLICFGNLDWWRVGATYHCVNYSS